jgi:hypothetical protein
LIFTHIEGIMMTDRAGTLIGGRRERMERVLERAMEAPTVESDDPITDEARRYLMGEAEDLYWNELEWEHITDEEALDEGPITELTFPGLLAFVRGLLLEEVMPDSLSPANPRPQVVVDVLGFLANRAVELEDGLAEPDDAGDVKRLGAELEMTSGLMDRVLYLYHGLSADDIERVEAETHAAG